jgi:hypothetical protein
MKIRPEGNGAPVLDRSRWEARRRARCSLDLALHRLRCAEFSAQAHGLGLLARGDGAVGCPGRCGVRMGIGQGAMIIFRSIVFHRGFLETVREESIIERSLLRAKFSTGVVLRNQYWKHRGITESRSGNLGASKRRWQLGAVLVWPSMWGPVTGARPARSRPERLTRCARCWRNAHGPAVLARGGRESRAGSGGPDGAGGAGAGRKYCLRKGRFCHALAPVL